jgi:DNA-binding NtrC family response regulator
MKESRQILIVDDEANIRKVLAALLDNAGFLTTAASSGEEAWDLVRAGDPDLVLTDLRMHGMDGIELLERLHNRYPEIPVVLLSAHGTVELAVEAMKRGAFDFLTKPFDKEKVLEVIHKALGQGERARLEFQGPFAPEARCGMVGESLAMRKLRELVEKVAPSPTTLLITGETGTGKELVAEALHRLSPRNQAPLVRLNCGALPENLVESELFGHERGAFTGASHSKPGRFELADKGTLFLDEVGDLPPSSQVKILRVLEDGRIDRVGGTKPRTVDVRLVAATNADLEKAVKGGSFRSDLLFRLRIVEIHVPSLRDRREDIPLLVEFFLDKHSERLGRDRPEAAPEAVEALCAGEWPGNVRELESAVERALLLGGEKSLVSADFGLGEGSVSASAPASIPGDLKSASKAAAAAAERRLIRAALGATAGNITGAG